jgi:hypothetical protein
VTDSAAPRPATYPAHSAQRGVSAAFRGGQVVFSDEGADEVVEADPFLARPPIATTARWCGCDAT